MSNNKKEFNPENYNPFDIGYVFEKEIDSSLDLFSQYDSELTTNPNAEQTKELDWIDSMYNALKQKEQEQSVVQEYTSPVIETPSFDNLWDLQVAWAEQNMKPQIENIHFEPQETRHVNTKDIIAQYQDTVINQPVNTLSTNEINQAIETAKIDNQINQTTAEDKSQNNSNVAIESQDNSLNISAQTVTQKINATRQKYHDPEKQKRIDEKVKAYNDRGKKEYTKPIEEIIQEQSDKMRQTHSQELYDANKLDNPARREKMSMLRDKHDVEMKQFQHDSNAKLYSHYNEDKYKNTREQSMELLKSRSAYFEKHGVASEPIKHYSKSKDFKNNEVKSQEVKNSINNNLKDSNFGKKNNSIKVTDPILSVHAMDKAIQNPEMQDKKLQFNNYFHDQDVGFGGYQNQRLSPQQEKNAGLSPNSPTTLKNNLARGLETNDPIRYMSSWATAEKSMNDAHAKIQEGNLVKGYSKPEIDSRVKFEKSLFAYNKAQAYQEGKAHFEQTNQKWLDMPTGSDTKDLKELKAQMHSDYQNYVATSMGVSINKEVSPVEAKMHAQHSQELYSKKVDSPEYKETAKIHSIEKEITQASIENKGVSKDISNDLKQLNYTKSYEFRDFNKEQVYEFNGSRGLNVDKTFNQENAKPMKNQTQNIEKPQQQVENVNVNKGQPKHDYKADINAVKSQMAEMRNSTGLKDNAFSQRQEQIKQSQPQNSNQFGGTNSQQQVQKPSVQDMKKPEPVKENQSFNDLQRKKLGNQNVEL